MLCRIAKDAAEILSRDWKLAWNQAVAALMGAIAAAMVGSIFSSDAWNNVTFIAGEMKNPKRNIGMSLFLGTLIVTIIYVFANLMYLNVLPLNELAYSQQMTG